MIKKLHKCILLFVACIAGWHSYAQELNDFDPRYTNETIRGNLTMTANSIVGLVYKNGFLNPNASYNVNNTSNGDNVTAYIDIDNDPTTFSSSSANLTVPREGCSKIKYAGLYWSANYYMARRDIPIVYTVDEITKDTETNVRLTINNSDLALDYIARFSEFENDNSDIKFKPVTSYLVVAQPETGCGITNGASLAGNIAVIRNTGSCSVREKVVNAQAAGAVGVVIVHTNENLPKLSGTGPVITIPSVAIANTSITNGNFKDEDLIPLLQAESNVVLATLSTTGNAQLTDLPLTDPRREGPANFENIKFKVPNGNYVDITAQDIVWDGYRNTATHPSNDANDEVQYVCYSEVTTLIDPDNPFGMYTVANMNATQGFTSTSDGACGGWVLVVVYEDLEESSKFISTQDGYAQIFSGATNPVDFSFSGFRTLQGNQPVDVLFGVAALEGDKAFLEDQLLIETPPIGSNTFTALGEGFNNFTDINPVRNFFNSSITIDNNFITDRIPASENTLGFDADLFRLPNDGNRLIGNNQTNANFRLTTGTDRFGVFFGAFSVTVIEPELQIIKRVYDVDGVTDITGQTVELGDEVSYDLEIENIGNEDFVDGSVVVTDVLPENVDLLEVVSVPAGVTFTPDAATNSIVFQIPSDIVETANDQPVGEGDAPIFIRYSAKLVSTCEELRDACSNIITSSASAVFTGALSLTDSRTLSTSELGSCGENLGEASNILVNVPACHQEVVSCDSTLQLIAGTGYSQYTWTGPSINGPLVQTGLNANILDISDAQSGVYTVVKEDNDGIEPSCMTLTEEFEVTLPTELNISAVATSQTICNGNISKGFINVTVEGGLDSIFTFSLYQDNTLVEEYVPLSFIRSHQFSHLDAGIYAVVVNNGDACPQGISNIIVEEQRLAIDAVVTPITNTPGSIVMNVTGSDVVAYELLDATGTSLVFSETNATFSIDTEGTYIVRAYHNSDCYEEAVVNVEATDTHPIVAYAEEILFCTLTGQSYPVVAIEDDQGEEVAVPFTDAVSIVWERLDEVACNRPLEDACPTTDDSCSSSWFTVAEGSTVTVLEPGEYRVVVNFAVNKSTQNTEKVYYFRAISDKVLGISEITKTAISIYPNPAIGIVTINTTDMKMVHVYDVAGNRVLQTVQNTFDSASLAAGMYFVAIETHQKSITMLKLLKK